MKTFYTLLTLALLVSCTKPKNLNQQKHTTVIIEGDTTIYKKLQPRWYFRSYDTDSVVGISLIKAYKELIKDKPGEEVVVAILDTDINTEHEDLKDIIWVNIDEIIGNKKDDDNNGYIDDINGWNFLRSSKGKRIIYSHYSSISYVIANKDKYENDSLSDTEGYKIYKKALNNIEENKKLTRRYAKEAEEYSTSFIFGKKQMDSLFKSEELIIDKLDSVYFLYESTNPVLAESAAFVADHYIYDWSDWAENQKKDGIANETTSNNINSDPRRTLSKDKGYGNPKINGDLRMLSHGTLVAGVIGANQKNDIGTHGVTNNVKLMILSVQTRQGSDNVTDISNAIRYAVDNGAKVINYSTSLIFSSDNELLQESLKYAEDNGVLFVTSAGNTGKNIDEKIIYPNANYKDRKLNNFLTIGASHPYIGDQLKIKWSNYGKENVDLFAPGLQIYTTNSKGTYNKRDGTSVSTAIVSGVAAMLYSYYPNLNAKEVKEIIMSTVDVYDQEVIHYNDSIGNFKDASKTGGILNAYAALKKAGIVSKKMNEE